jgi:RNA polymerase sigma factor (sigma-70 family)
MSRQLLHPGARLRPYDGLAQQLGAETADTVGMPAAAATRPALQFASRLRRGASDERLVAAVRRGDERAFEALYDRYHQPLLAFCRHMLGTREEAEDALQHVFVSAHRHLREQAGPEHLKAWLYTVARNRCMSILRARREAISIEAEYEPCTDGLVVAGAVERRQEVEELLGDLARLPDDQRAALVLAELGDLAHEDIAVALGVRKDKVKALIFQARETLGGWRQAREVSCRDIQEQLATLRGSALRRAELRRHVALCAGCAAFESEVARQRTAMALLLPVVPGVALKHSVLSAAGASSAAGAAGAAGAGAGATGVAASAGATGLTAKALVVTALAIGAGGAGTIAVRELDPPRPPRSAIPAQPGVAPATPAAPAAAAAALAPARLEQRERAGGQATAPGRTAAKSTRGRSAAAPGHTRARPAKARGPHVRSKVKRGRHTGAAKPHPTKPVHTMPATSRRPTAPKAVHTAPRTVHPAPATSQRPASAPAPAVTRAPAKVKVPAAVPPAAAVPATPAGKAARGGPKG